MARRRPVNRLRPNNYIPHEVRRQIFRWAEEHLFSQEQVAPTGELEINLCGVYEKNECFLTYEGQDYYVLGQKFRGETDIEIKLLRTVADLPVMLPASIPREILKRLNER